MQEIDNLINVEHQSADSVRVAVSEAMANSLHLLGLHISVEDLSKEYLYARDFLDKIEQPEQVGFYREFDLSSFNIEVRIFGTCTLGRLLHHVLTDVIASEISLRLDARAIVLLENGAIPLRLHNRGRVSESFDRYWKSHFSNTIWSPQNED